MSDPRIWYVQPFDYVLPFRGEQLTLNRVWHVLKAEGVDYATRCSLVRRVMERIMEEHLRDGRLEGNAYISHAVNRSAPDYVEFEDAVYALGCDPIGIGVGLRGHDATLMRYYGTSPRMLDLSGSLKDVIAKRQELIDQGVWDEEPEDAVSPDEFGEGREKECEENPQVDKGDVALYASQHGLWD